MTVTVNRNPKKSRPYDEPPKRRRSLIPDTPDSAAKGFFVAAAVWLVVATGIGLLAIGTRIIPIEFSFSLVLFDLAFSMDMRRLDAAFLNATVFGWLTNVGFAAIVFMTPRLVGRPLAGARLLSLAVAIWNLALAGGIAALYVFDLGPNAALSAMPWFVEGGLATAALIVTGSFLVTVLPSIASAYISIWFAGVALLGLLGLLGLNATIGLVELFFELPDLAVALVAVFVERAIVTLWLLGVMYATLYYVVPRATGLPLASGGLAILAWLTWLALAPLSPLATLRDPSIPYAVTSIGAVATMLLLVPAALTTVNLAQSMQGRWSLLFGVGTLAFAAVSLVFLLGTSLLAAIGTLESVRAAVGGTDWERGVTLWIVFGTCTFAGFAIAEHAMPRIHRRAWGGGTLAGAQLWLAFAGVTFAGVALMGGGLAEGSLRAAGGAPDAVASSLLLYRIPAFLFFGLVALAGLAMLANFFLLYTSAEPVEYVLPGQPAPATGH